MARRRRQRPEPDPVDAVDTVDGMDGADGLDAGEGVAEPAPEPVPEPDYYVGTWRGIVRFACARCPWDCLEDEEAMRRHVRELHRPPEAAPPSRRVSPILDHRGNAIVREV